MTASPDTPEAGFPADAVEVARVLGAWGVKGWIRVQPLATQPQALFSSRHWYLREPVGVGGGRAPRQPVLDWPRVLRIRQLREQGKDVLASVRDIDEREAAEALRGARIFVPRSSFPSTADDEYYWVDLIGMQVLNRQGVALGEVAGLIDTGVHSVLRLREPQGAADAGGRLIPFVAAYVDRVDREARCIHVDWGEDY